MNSALIVTKHCNLDFPNKDHSLDEVNLGKEEDKVDAAKKEDEKVMIEYVLVKLLQLNFIFARI